MLIETLKAMVVVCGASVLVAFAAACTDDDDNGDGAGATATVPAAASSTPAQSPEPTIPVGPCPVDDPDVCAFADQVLTLLVAADYDGIVTLARAQEYECPGVRPDGAGGPFPLCDDAPAGERRMGYIFGRLQSEGGIASAEGLAADIESFAEGEGTGPPGLASIGCAAEEGATGCANSFVLIFTREGSQSLLRFGVSRSADATQIVETFQGLTVLNPAYISGGDEDAPPLLSEPASGDSTRYIAVD
jgi:hypothetical protein